MNWGFRALASAVWISSSRTGLSRGLRYLVRAFLGYSGTALSPLLAIAPLQRRLDACFRLVSRKSRSLFGGTHRHNALCPSRFTREAAETYPLERSQQYALSRILSYVFFALSLVVGLESVGLNLSSLLVVGGALGIGVGFGLQSIVANFVAGLILLLEQSGA